MSGSDKYIVELGGAVNRWCFFYNDPVEAEKLYQNEHKGKFFPVFHPAHSFSMLACKIVSPIWGTINFLTGAIAGLFLFAILFPIGIVASVLFAQPKFLIASMVTFGLFLKNLALAIASLVLNTIELLVTFIPSLINIFSGKKEDLVSPSTENDTTVVNTKDVNAGDVDTRANDKNIDDTMPEDTAPSPFGLSPSLG